MTARLLLSIIIAATGHFVIGQTFKFDYAEDFKAILAETQDAQNKLYYPMQLMRFNVNDTSLTSYEVLALMIGFTNNPSFKPYHYLTAERKIYTLNDGGNYTAAIQLADSLLMFVPVSQQALIEKAYAHHKLGQEREADNAMWKFGAIMFAMMQSGNGLTPETAIFSLGPTDGQNYIRKKITPEISTMGSGHDKNGNFVDILTAMITDPNTGEKKEVPMYFQIQHAVTKMFEPGEQEKAKKAGRKSKTELKVDKDGKVRIEND